jgi:sec-independent protein translocase protein TatA
MPFNIGPGELILILIIALVVLGPGKLPDVAASLGKGLREFRKAASDVTEAGKIDAPATPTPPAAVPSPPPPAATPAPAPSDATASAPSEPSGDSNQS